VYALDADITLGGDAEISYNTARRFGSGIPQGGGVYLLWSTLTMLGGADGAGNNPRITGNMADGSNAWGQGGGVYIINLGGAIPTIFDMHGGIISGNSIITGGYSWGGGVYVDSAVEAKFYMSGGTIYGNEASAELRNNAVSGAALYKVNNGIAKYGINGAGNYITTSGNAGSPDPQPAINRNITLTWP
jgi:hypothetical protein